LRKHGFYRKLFASCLLLMLLLLLFLLLLLLWSIAPAVTNPKQGKGCFSKH